MRRPFVIRAQPSTNIGGIADAFAQAYANTPDPAEQRRAEELHDAKVGYYGARTQDARAQAEQRQAEMSGNRKIADLFSGIDYSGEDFYPSGPHPSQQNRTDAPTTSPENTLTQYRGNQLEDAAREAVSVAVSSGMDPGEASKRISMAMQQFGASPDQIQRFRYGVDPSYELGVNDALSVPDREAVAERNAANDRALAITKERASPISVGEGDMVVPGVGDPRGGEGPLQGRDTASTAEARLINRAASGEKLTPQQASIAGADGSRGTPRNYLTPDNQSGTTLDGVTDANTGERLPQGTTVYTGQIQGDDTDVLRPNVKGSLQEGQIAFKDFMSTLDATRKVAESSPDIFGTIGNVRRLGQGAVGQLRAIVPGQFENIAKDLQDAGVAPKYYDPNLTDVEKLATLLAYQGASALAKQEGRGLSDQDFRRFREVIGDPTSWLETQEKFLQGLDTIEALAKSMYRNRQEALGGDLSMPSGGEAQGGQDDPLGIR